VATFGVPARLRDKTLDAYLDAVNPLHKFTDLAAAAQAADDRTGVATTARALHSWLKEKNR
jgi:hypothetical protein